MDILRQLEPSDFLQVAVVYRDAVMSQAQGLYSQVQIEAWAANAERDNGLRTTLERGLGLASCAGEDLSTIEAIAVLDPINRLSLLYCRGRACRQGRATILLHAIEDQARQRGCDYLHTEASQLSRPLLEREGWRVDAEEEAIFAGERFLRWRMMKELILLP